MKLVKNVTYVEGEVHPANDNNEHEKNRTDLRIGTNDDLKRGIPSTRLVSSCSVTGESRSECLFIARFTRNSCVSVIISLHRRLVFYRHGFI